jgi:hypothetical protein
MPFTREQGKAALKHIVLTVMNQPDDGPMAKSLLAKAMIENIEDLGSLIETDIEKFSFIATTGFAVKQTYVFVVFEKTLLTDQGKARLMPESTRKNLMLSLFIGALANMLF